MKAFLIFLLSLLVELVFQNAAFCSVDANRTDMKKYCWATRKDESCGKDSDRQLYSGETALAEAQGRNPYASDLDGNTSPASKANTLDNRTPSSTAAPQNSVDTAPPTQARNHQQAEAAAKGAQGEAVNELEKLRGDNRFLSDDMRRTARNAAEKAQEIARLESERRAADSTKYDPKTRDKTSGIINDVELTQVIERKVLEGKKVSQEEASKAYNEEIRKSLLTIPLGYEAKEEIKQEETKLSTALAQLTQMATLAAARSKGMGTQEGSGKKPSEEVATAKAIDEANVAKAPLFMSADALSDLAVDKLLDEKLAAALAKAEASNKAAGRFPLTPEEKLNLRNKLRAGLRQQLIAQAKANAEAKSGALDSFTGGLNREQVASAQSSEEQATHGLGDVIGSTFSAVKEAGFSMAHSETEAAVNGFMAESGRELASLPSDFPGPNSPSLFLRANQAHQRCEARQCVSHGTGR